jgi:hypothetical protein
MGFRKPDLVQARMIIATSMAEIKSPYNDGFTAWGCKKELYVLKLWLDDQFEKLPHYTGEDEWLAEIKKLNEQERIINILKSE